MKNVMLHLSVGWKKALQKIEKKRKKKKKESQKLKSSRNRSSA